MLVRSTAGLATSTTTRNPSGATKYYCSHSNYDHSHLSHLHTCIARTLSCELSPSKSVAFTSSDVWVIGTAFSLKARGFHRRYCLIFTFLPESQTTNCENLGENLKSSTASTSATSTSSKNQHHHQQHRGGGSTSGGRSTREDYSGSDFKGTGTSYYPSFKGTGISYYTSLVPHYEYITEQFYKFTKSSLQTECEKVYDTHALSKPQDTENEVVSNNLAPEFQESDDDDDIFSVLPPVLCVSTAVVSELDVYLTEDLLPPEMIENGRKAENDILNYWRENSAKFPILSEMARIYLAIPASSGDVERLFSVAGAIKRQRRNKLKISRLEAILLVKEYSTPKLSKKFSS